MSSSGERGEREREAGSRGRGGALERGVGTEGTERRDGRKHPPGPAVLSSQALVGITSSCNKEVTVALLPVLGRLTQRELRVCLSPLASPPSSRS